MEFKEWDRVIVNTEYRSIVNKKATVLGKNKFGMLMLRLDECISRHGCNGICKNGHGFYVIPGSLTTISLITNKKETA